MKAIFLILILLILAGCDNILNDEDSNFVNPYLEYSIQFQNNFFKQIKSNIKMLSKDKNLDFVIHHSILTYSKYTNNLDVSTYHNTISLALDPLRKSDYLRRISDSLWIASGLTKTQIKWAKRLLNIYVQSITENITLDVFQSRLAQYDQQIFNELGPHAKDLLFASAMLYSIANAIANHFDSNLFTINLNRKDFIQEGDQKINWESLICSMGFGIYGEIISGAFALAGGPVGMGLAFGFSLTTMLAGALVCSMV